MMWISDVVIITIACVLIGLIIAMITLDIATCVQAHKQAKKVKEEAEKALLNKISTQLEVINNNLLIKDKEANNDRKSVQRDNR